MSSCNKCNFNACSCGCIQIALLVGAAIALLFFFGNLPFFFIAAIVALVVAVIALLVLVGTALFAAATSSPVLRRCSCGNSICLLVGIIGTIILGIAVLTVPVFPFVVGFAVLVGIATFFFTLLFIALIAFILCIICSLCSRE